MKIRLLSFVILFSWLSGTLFTGGGPVCCSTLTAECQDDMIIVRIDGKTFTCYRFGEGQKYPYFYPVNGPLSGISVTTESSLPYPHHRSLFFGLDRVNGGNYWQEGNDRGRIVSTGPRILANGPENVVIEDECVWKQPDAEPIIVDRRIITIAAPSDSLRSIEFSIVLTARTDIRVEKTNHSLFSARMDPALSVEQGGVLVNAGGDRNQEGTLDQKSPWCDYYGIRFGVTEGLAIFDSPLNLWYPSPWLTRNYGFFSPTPMNLLDENGFSMKNGETLKLVYRVIIHGGTTEQAGIKGLYNEWSESVSK